MVVREEWKRCSSVRKMSIVVAIATWACKALTWPSRHRRRKVSPPPLLLVLLLLLLLLLLGGRGSDMPE
jgi:hypothetical protein